MSAGAHSATGKHKTVLVTSHTEQRPKKMPKLISQSQGLDVSRGDTINVIHSELSQLVGIWNNYSPNDVLISQEVRMEEMREQLGRYESKARQLQCGFNEVQEEYCSLLNSTNDEVRTRDEIVEKMKLTWGLTSLIDKHYGAMTGTLQRCVEGKEHLQEMYNNVILKQEAKIQSSIENFDAQVQKEKEELKTLLDMQTAELLEVRSKYEKVEAEATKRSQMLMEVESERDDCGKKLADSKILYEENMMKLSFVMGELETRLLAAGTNATEMTMERKKLLQQLEDVKSRCQVAECRAGEYKKQVEVLESRTKEKDENNITELRAKYECDAVDHKKLLQDLRQFYTSITSKYNEMKSQNVGLENDPPKSVDLQRILEHKDAQLLKLTVTLKSIMEKNTELKEVVESLKKRLEVEKATSHQAEEDVKKWKLRKNEMFAPKLPLKEQVVPIEQQLKEALNECGSLKAMIEQMKIKGLKASKIIKQMEEKIKRKNYQISELTKTIGNLREEKEMITIAAETKIKDLTTLLKAVEQKDEKERNEHSMTVTDLRQELMATCKEHDTNTNAVTENSDGDNTQLKDIQMRCDDPKENFFVIKEPNDELQIKYRNAEICNESEGNNRCSQMTPSAITHKPILKSPIRMILPKPKKVQFESNDDSDVRDIYEPDLVIMHPTKSHRVRGKFFNRSTRCGKTKNNSNNERFISE